MAGLYLHIPFCRKLCYYCDFHFTVSLKQKDRVVDALVSELERRASEANGLSIDTIYFGGGTPSVLTIDELIRIFRVITAYYPVTVSPEITLETNPDDLEKEFLTDLRNYTPVNRLSIGIQSFTDRDLKFLNRRHDAAEAINCIERAKGSGFTNMNIDLIYGIPGMSIAEWENNLNTFRQFEIPHLSAYHLTIEPKTVFGHYLKKGKIKPVNEETSLNQFEMLIDFTEEHGFDHYEISNFARQGLYSMHNLGYWTGKPYIGIGPSAHSYTGTQRRWNVANNTHYCYSIEKNTLDYFETENIDGDKAFNEYVLTTLRTKWGIDTSYILRTFGKSALEFLMREAVKFIDVGILQEEGTHLVLSKKGKFLADFVISTLMIV